MRKHATWGTVAVGIALAIAILAFATWHLLQAAGPNVDIPFELAKATMSLISALVIAGLLSALLAWVAAGRSSREEPHQALTVDLQELKAAYERVQVARFYLQARTTARALVEQLPTFMEARALLHRVQRDRFVLGTEVEHQVQDMLDYITAIANEYRDHASRVVQASLEEEALMQHIRDGEPEAVGDGARLEPATFPRITAMLADESAGDSEHAATPWKQQSFHLNYRSARDSLQASMEALAPRRGQ